MHVWRFRSLDNGFCSLHTPWLWSLPSAVQSMLLFQLFVRCSYTLTGRLGGGLQSLSNQSDDKVEKNTWKAVVVSGQQLASLKLNSESRRANPGERYKGGTWRHKWFWITVISLPSFCFCFFVTFTQSCTPFVCLFLDKHNITPQD